MGNLITRNRSQCINSLSDWEHEMDQYKIDLNRYTKLSYKYQQKSKLYSICWFVTCIILGIITIVIMKFYKSLLMNKWFILSWIVTFFFFKVVSSIYDYMQRSMIRNIKIIEESKKELENSLYDIQATVNELTRVIQKFNLENRLLNNPMVQEYKKEIKLWENCVKQLLKLPLCIECKENISNYRISIIKTLPNEYQHELLTIQPDAYDPFKPSLPDRIMNVVNPGYQDPMNYLPLPVNSSNSLLLEDLNNVNTNLLINSNDISINSSAPRQTNMTCSDSQNMEVKSTSQDNNIKSDIDIQPIDSESIEEINEIDQQDDHKENEIKYVIKKQESTSSSTSSIEDEKEVILLDSSNENSLRQRKK